MLFDNFDFESSPTRVAAHAAAPSLTSSVDRLTSDDGKNNLVFAESSADWRVFIPEGFETLTRLRKDYGCGLSAST